jgi:hypothetical protein
VRVSRGELTFPEPRLRKGHFQHREVIKAKRQLVGLGKCPAMPVQFFSDWNGLICWRVSYNAVAELAQE